MKIFNILTQNSPIVIHCPGKFDHYYWKYFSDYSQSYKEDKELTVLTWNTGSYKRGLGVLEKSLKGYPILNCASDFDGNWSNDMKIRLLAKANIKTKYVIGADSSDIVFIDSPSEVLRRFKNKNCKMLFNAEKFYFPSDMPVRKDFQDFIGKNHIFKYMNAGLWIAETEYLKFAVDECLKELNNSKICKYTGSEQIIWHAVFPRLRDIALDYECEIFQNIAKVEKGEISFAPVF